MYYPKKRRRYRPIKAPNHAWNESGSQKQSAPCHSEMLKLRKLLRFLVGKNLDNAPNMLIKPFGLGGLFWLNDFFQSNARLNKAGRVSKLITLYHGQDQCDEKAKQEKAHSSLPPAVPPRISLTNRTLAYEKKHTRSAPSDSTLIHKTGPRHLAPSRWCQHKMADINKAMAGRKCTVHRL